MSTLREQIIQKHIRENMPNSRIVHHNDADSGLSFYNAQQLQTLDTDWFPLCCEVDPATGKLRYGGRDKVTHTYVEGETGAGKTTRFAIQSIRALSSMKVKPSFLVVDIYGEIIENLYPHLIEQGYAVKILNCDDPAHSDCYNPFAALVKRCQQNGELDNEGYNRLRRIAEIIQPVQSNQDPIWDQGARSYTNGAILDKFEDLIAGDIPPESVNLYNIIENHYWLRNEMCGRYGTSDLQSLDHYKKKGTDSLAVQKMMSVTNNAERTRASYFGVVENHYDAFGQPSMYQLSSRNTIDMEEFIEKPTVIVIQSGNTRVGDDLVALMVNDIYTTVVRMGKQSATKLLPRRIHCFLDEFANVNIADGADFIKMLTTSRKFGMFWHLLLQCDAQLDTKFNSTTARIIRSNCTELFMGSQDYDTIVRFARSCGQKTVESLESTLSQRYASLETVDLMTPDRLSLTQEGYIYVKSNRHPLLKTYFEAFYNCDEYVPVEDITSIYPVNDFDYRKTRFCPSDIPEVISAKEFAIVRYLHEYRTCTQSELRAAMHFHNFDNVFGDLRRRKMIELNEGAWSLDLTEAQYELLANRSYPPEPEDEEEEVVTEDEEPFSSVMPNVASIFMDDVNEKPNHFVVDLTEHFNSKPRSISSDLIEKFTCLPEFLKIALLDLANGRPVSSEDAFPDSDNIMKFEILEAFIGGNNYATKRKWVESLRKEFASLKRTNWLPASLHVPFENSLTELSESLTLSNIKEIRKIIHDSDET